MLQNRIPRRAVAAAGLTLLGCTSANAALMSYTDFQTFETALSNAGLTSERQGFDSTAAGTSLNGATVGGFSFSNFNITQGGVTAQIANIGNNARSPSNVIGTTATTPGLAFQDNDSYDISFAPTQALGLFFLTLNTPPTIAADVFSLTVGSESVGNSATPDPGEDNNAGVPLFGTDKYFLGFIDTASTFGSATITSTNLGDQFDWYNDDFYTAAAVPVPATLALLGVGMGILGAARLRRRRCTD
ncbi:hypothetical protein CKO31_04395 [Thiohalocapsa halophila]|uniref:PEP-CTERM sorting domain-containing protein n=1 Tax=Thiohalocapsa halophila TaxID=69359 RepID=A0ABS1CEQ2_9GAMM|nr:PEP-CTERM sorting domain-containing protein [Thiohalocapsa halophila]MBK1629994.1 hypothetical protein [Thiohalocapsa halophila]